MKKGLIKIHKNSKSSLRRSREKRLHIKSCNSQINGVNPNSYAKTISFIVRSEENETKLMIASTSSVNSKKYQ